MLSEDPPSFSITLPKDFAFHYTDGREPRTPEPKQAAPRSPSPSAYRLRRRTRPSILSPGLYRYSCQTDDSQQTLIPTIEGPVLHGSNSPVQHPVVDSVEGYLAPRPPGRSMTLPRTPSPELTYFGGDWHSRLGTSTNRPMSSYSVTSNSSADSDFGSETDSLGGSCTSPESDTSDPFFQTPRKVGKSVLKSPFIDGSPTLDAEPRSRPLPVFWTAEMDKHIWTIYMRYLQDPTVTPFKMLPGSPPPLGVCHRVARAAKRSWRNGKTDKAATDAQTSATETPGRATTPETIKGERSGSTTPTAAVSLKLQAWPKSNRSTRRRLRELCKRKATIAPHYQRLLQSRSPSPFSSSRTNSRSMRLSSPMDEQVFATRDVQLSLTTATSMTMQPDGPLAQLARTSPTEQHSRDWFNNPSVAWTSSAPASNDAHKDINALGVATEIPRLGSPFGHHTWGPTRSQQMVRPTTPTSIKYDDVDMAGPTLRSPVQFHGTFPNNHKRRAQHQLEDELSPGGSNRAAMLQDLFGAPLNSSQRRVRSRGLSLGRSTNRDHLTNLFTPPPSLRGPQTTGASDAPPVDQEAAMRAPCSDAGSIGPLGSPFAGISSRPSRVRGIHVSSAKYPSWDPTNIPSIDQCLDPSDGMVFD